MSPDEEFAEIRRRGRWHSLRRGYLTVLGTVIQLSAWSFSLAIWVGAVWLAHVFLQAVGAL